MKSKLLSIICLLFCCHLMLGQKYITKTGTIDFAASVPSFEEVEASNNNVSAILNVDTGEFVALALMKGFRFKVALMEEHFNENYIESSEFPKATFKGNISNFDPTSISDTFQTYILIGEINMHGINKNVEVPTSIKMENGMYYITTNFILKPEDFNIEIPKIVSNKIAEDIYVSGSFELKHK